MKQEEDKAKEGQMWNRLGELNREFKKIKLNCSKIFISFNVLIVNCYLNQINAQKMSDSGFFLLLPTNKLYKKENIRRLKNFPAVYVGKLLQKFGR